MPTSVRDRAELLYHRFRQALDRGNVTDALSAATEIQVVGLIEALELTLPATGRPEAAEYEQLSAWHAALCA